MTPSEREIIVFSFKLLRAYLMAFAINIQLRPSLAVDSFDWYTDSV